MDEKKVTRTSKLLSLVLRHAPEKIDLQLDAAGWANVNELIVKMKGHNVPVDEEFLKHVVTTNAKKRFTFNEDGTKIRANQGHSIVVDHGFSVVTPPKILYHGTHDGALTSIFRTGLEKRNRHHVHLSNIEETALKVGQRHGKAVILKIRALDMERDGHTFFLSENEVWLTLAVPVEYIEYKIKQFELN